MNLTIHNQSKMENIETAENEARMGSSDTNYSNINELPSKIKMLFLFILYLPCLFINLNLDNDVWFLLNSGKYVVEHGIPYIEPFTMHQNMNFMMQQWLSAVIFWSTYAKFGSFGLFTLIVFIFFLVITVIFKLNQYISNGNLVATFFATYLAVILLPAFMITRPILFTVLILIIEIYLLERYADSSRVANLIPLPFLSVLQINLQAAMWPMLFIILVPCFIDSFKFKILMIKGQGYKKKALFLTTIIMVLAGFLNPYGIDAMTYLLRSYGYKEMLIITEMQAANINNIIGMEIFGLFFVLGAIYLLYRQGKMKLRYVLLILGTAVLVLSSIRNFSLFLVCGIFPLAYYLKDIQLPKKVNKEAKNTPLLRKILIAIMIMALGYAIYVRYTVIRDYDETPEVDAAVNYLLTNADVDSMVLYTAFNDGGYAEFKGLRPYIDPRAEVFVKKNNGIDDIMLEFYELHYGRLYYKDFLEKYQFTHLLVSKNTRDIFNVYLPRDNAYKIVYEDGDYLVFEKKSQ